MNGRACSPRRTRLRLRRGGALLVIIALVVIVSVFLAHWYQSSLQRHLQQQWRAWELQATWLVESGIERTAAQLAKSADYQGETWNLTADELFGKPGQVQVAVRPTGDPQVRQVEVIARFPYRHESPAHSVTRRKHVTIHLPSREQGDNAS